MSFMGLLLQVGIVIYIIEANIREESERMLASAYWDWIRKLFGINEQVFKKAIQEKIFLKQLG